MIVRDEPKKGDIDMEEPIEKVRKSELYRAQKEKGLDVEALMEKAMLNPRYVKAKAPATHEAMLRNAINPQEDEGKPFDEYLLILGGGDRYGKTFPCKFIALRQNNKFVFVNDFDANRYPVPCKCRIVGKFTDDKYGFNVNSTRGVVSEIEEKSFEDVQKILQKYQITHKDWDKLERLCENGSEIRVFRGKIASLRLAGVFNDGAKVGDLPVLSLNERTPPRLHPTMQIGLESSGGLYVSANLDRQRNGSPVYNLADFEDTCVDAMEQFPEDKTAQLEYLKPAVIDREVIIVMNVWGNKPGKNDKRYITGSCSFMMEALDIPLKDARETLQVEEEFQPSSSSEHVENPYVEALVKSCEVLNQDPKFVPVAKAREIASIGADVSDNLVQEMCKRASQVWNERKKV